MTTAKMGHALFSLTCGRMCLKLQVKSIVSLAKSTKPVYSKQYLNCSHVESMLVSHDSNVDATEIGSNSPSIGEIQNCISVVCMLSEC